VGIPPNADHEGVLRRGLAILESGRKVVFISRYVRDVWQGIAQEQNVQFPHPSEYRVIYHALDLDEFSPSAQCHSGSFVIGTAGALRHTFRLATLFQVSRRLEFDHRLLIVGSLDEECKRVLSDAMKDPELSARTSYVPWIDSEALPSVYRRMHCLFHPFSGEGCGIVVTEALACGVPVVAPEFGAPSEFILPEGGIAVHARPYQYDEEFCEMMAEAVTKIHTNYDSFARGARLQAEQHLSISSCIDEYLNFMELPRSLHSSV
jgi:glycosyltransferase involved in cell wall biosynthesis